MKTGRRTQHVEFITDGLIRNIVHGGRTHEGPVITQPWKFGRTYNIPRTHCERVSTKAHCPYQRQVIDEPYRICFVLEPSGDVSPLQQCTDVKFERDHKINADNWFRTPWSLIGAWEPTPVS